MEQYRIDLAEVFAFNITTMENTDRLPTEKELQEYLEEIVANDQRLIGKWLILRCVERGTNKTIVEVSIN